MHISTKIATYFLQGMILTGGIVSTQSVKQGDGYGWCKHSLIINQIRRSNFYLAIIILVFTSGYAQSIRSTKRLIFPQLTNPNELTFTNFRPFVPKGTCAFVSSLGKK